METYLRFTTDFNHDNYSYFKVPSMDKAKRLPGICAFPFNIEGMSREEIENKVKVYAKNFSYYNEGTAVIFEGEFITKNTNDEGVIVSKGRKLYEFNDL